MEINRNRCKSVNIHWNPLKSMQSSWKSLQNPWKSMQITENPRQIRWKSMKIDRKSTENQWKSIANKLTSIPSGHWRSSGDMHRNQWIINTQRVLLAERMRGQGRPLCHGKLKSTVLSCKVGWAAGLCWLVIRYRAVISCGAVCNIHYEVLKNVKESGIRWKSVNIAWNQWKTVKNSEIWWKSMKIVENKRN